MSRAGLSFFLSVFMSFLAIEAVAGTTNSSSSSSSSWGFHAECKNEAPTRNPPAPPKWRCVGVKGDGENKCQFDIDCDNKSTRKVCKPGGAKGQVCTTISVDPNGPQEPDECDGKNYLCNHRVCKRGASGRMCVTVDGPGMHECETARDCPR